LIFFSESAGEKLLRQCKSDGAVLIQRQFKYARLKKQAAATKATSTAKSKTTAARFDEPEPAATSAKSRATSTAKSKAPTSQS
jgi:hypothetical protein